MAENMINDKLIAEYLEGPRTLRETVAGMSERELDASPIPGQWSTRQVVGHIVDFDLVYADRIKRVIAEEVPVLFGGDPDTFAARLAYECRDVDDEICLLEAIRFHVARILRSLKPVEFQRRAVHKVDGFVTLQTLLKQITNHIPHHVIFIRAKRNALAMHVPAAN